jgi:hypothetical protein
MTPVKCILVASPPGARSDFVAGWLGTLNNFVDNRWQIDPLTGMSSGLQRMTKILDKPDHITLQQRLSELDMQLSAASELTFAGSVHGFDFYKIKLKPRLPWDDYGKTFKILYIHVPEHDQSVMDQIRWEFFCKSYLSGQYDWKVLLNDPTVEIEQLASQEFNTFHEFSNYQIPMSTSAEYAQLFAPGGSVYLCDLLGISATAKDHQAWDQALLQANSPDEITQFGRVWRREDHSLAIRS